MFRRVLPELFLYGIDAAICDMDYNLAMENVTKILDKIEQGEESAASELMPVIYGELRKLAAQKLAREKASPSIQPTVLVHDAYVRLVDKEQQQKWTSRGHFFGAAAEAMRRILIENARRKQSLKRGGDAQKVPLELAEPAVFEDSVDLLALHDALTEFEQEWPEKAKLVKLRYFTGLTIAEAAKAMGFSESTAERHWKFARAWLYAKLDV